MKHNHHKDNQANSDWQQRISLVNQGVFSKKRGTHVLSDIPESHISYKNIELLKRFLSERGKMLPSRVTGVPFKVQRKLSNAIKRARILGLLSFTSN